MLIVTDKEGENLNLPSGEFDLPVVIQDRSLDNKNQLVCLDRGRMDRMTGFLGNRIFINGKSEQSLSLKAGCAYRLRLLNASNSRFYKLAWSDGTPVTVIGIDGSKIILRFEDFKDLFLYHCHNLEHEDMGMMRNYKIS